MNHDYPSCTETYATMRVYTGAMHPQEVTARLGLTPTRMCVVGAVHVNSIGRRRVDKLNAWFLSSREHVSSLDARAHLDWLLAQLASRSEALTSLQRESGVRMDISCTWFSRAGHGGPTLSPAQMRALAELDLELGFEIMFDGDWDDPAEQRR